MTARSKVTLVEAQRIRTHLLEVAGNGTATFDVVDRLLALGLIDTDAALRALESDVS